MLRSTSPLTIFNFNDGLSIVTHNMWSRFTDEELGATLTKALFGIFCNWLAPRNLRVKKNTLAKKNALFQPPEMDIPLGERILS